jgi:hypothetical protein
MMIGAENSDLVEMTNSCDGDDEPGSDFIIG